MRTEKRTKYMIDISREGEKQREKDYKENWKE